MTNPVVMPGDYIRLLKVSEYPHLLEIGAKGIVRRIIPHGSEFRIEVDWGETGIVWLRSPWDRFEICS